MVMLFAGITRARLIAWLALGLCVIAAAQINGQEKASPATSESAPQREESSSEPEGKGDELPTVKGDEKPSAATSDEAPSFVELPALEPSPSKEGEAGLENEAYRKKGRARARASAALAALVILGFAMVGLTWLGARVTRRYMFGPSGQPQPVKPTLVREDDWASKPLVKQKPPPADGEPSTPS